MRRTLQAMGRLFELFCTVLGGGTLAVLLAAGLAASRGEIVQFEVRVGAPSGAPTPTTVRRTVVDLTVDNGDQQDRLTVKLLSPVEQTGGQ